MTAQLYFLQRVYTGQGDLFATFFLLHRPRNMINFAISLWTSAIARSAFCKILTLLVRAQFQEIKRV